MKQEDKLKRRQSKSQEKPAEEAPEEKEADIVEVAGETQSA